MAAERDLPERRLAVTAGRARPHAPAEPPVPALLGLQRTAGNAAVARMLTGARRRSLQRKIGFELEAGDWSSALLDRPLEEAEQQSGAVPLTAKTKPPDARKAFYEKGNIKGTADELPGDKRDVEFVIKERDEGEGDAIAQDFDNVVAAFDHMHSNLPGEAWMWSEKRLGWSPPDPGVWLLDNPTGSRTVELQATAGLPLEEIATLAGMLHTPIKSSEDEAEQARLDQEAAKGIPATDPRRQLGLHVRAGNVLAFAQSDAETAVTAFADARPDVDGLQEDPQALIGLMTLMMQMLEGGNVPAGDEEKSRFSYPKAMAHLLPRTDFAHMFGRLSQPLQDALRAPDAIDTGRPAFVALVATMCEVGKIGGIDKPVLGWSKWGQIGPGMIVPDLTREAWAQGIVARQDRLSQAGYLAWLDSRKETLEPEVYEQRKKESKQLDSLGAWKHKMDERGPAKLPLVEFRALVREDLQRSITVPEAKQVGVRLAKYIDRILS
jgi:hypothetical protein